jgi:hypothetical protein
MMVPVGTAGCERMETDVRMTKEIGSQKRRGKRITGTTGKRVRVSVGTVGFGRH